MTRTQQGGRRDGIKGGDCLISLALASCVSPSLVLGLR